MILDVSQKETQRKVEIFYIAFTCSSSIIFVFYDITIGGTMAPGYFYDVAVYTCK